MTLASNVLFLCSGGGGNMRFIHRLIELGQLPGLNSISVIADRQCQAVEWASENGLKAEVISVLRDNQAELISACKSHPASVVITNIHKLIGPELISLYRDRILNLHYSLLPAFGGSIGMRSLSNALAYGSRIVGATAHHVTEDLDSGPPIAQVALGTVQGENDQGLEDLMFRAGCLALFCALRIHLDPPLAQSPAGAYTMNQSALLISPFCGLPNECSNENFWSALRS